MEWLRRFLFKQCKIDCFFRTIFFNSSVESLKCQSGTQNDPFLLWSRGFLRFRKKSYNNFGFSKHANKESREFSSVWKMVHSYFITTLNAFYGTYLHTCYSTHAVNNRLGFGIFLARRLDISCLRRTVGLNSKNTPKNKIKKSVKLIDHSCSCNDLTNFEYQVHAMTRNGR